MVVKGHPLSSYFVNLCIKLNQQRGQSPDLPSESAARTLWQSTPGPSLPVPFPVPVAPRGPAFTAHDNLCILGAVGGQAAAHVWCPERPRLWPSGSGSWPS